jgi:DNA transposition AAA+ family ATPase
MEIIYWKYGSYLKSCGEYLRAKRYLKIAIKICKNCPDYLTMTITGIGIQAELLEVLEKLQTDSDAERETLENTIKQVLDKKLDDGTKDFVKQLWTEFKQKDYMKISERITY